MNQKQRLLNWLKENRGMCAMLPLRFEPPITRVAARIHELRQDGEVIVTRTTCPEHLSGKAPHAYYYWSPF